MLKICLVCLLLIMSITLVVYLIHITHQPSNQEPEPFVDDSESSNDNTKYIVVDAEWGMCNRLRTYNTVYEMAMRVQRQMIIVNDTDQYKEFFGGDWEMLINVPVPMVKKSFLDGKDMKKLGTPNEDCGVTLSIEELAKETDKYVLIRSCEVVVGDLDIKNEFYHLMRPSRQVQDVIKDPLERIRRDKCVGVHIRQGNISDYNYGYFFGKWDNSAKQNPLMCCFADTNKNLSACPENVIVIERFVEAMRAEPETTSFFVCTDRPGCMLWLEQAFPKRIVYNKIQVEYDVDHFLAFCDWYCLAHCHKMILTGPSSFSTEAAKLFGAQTVFL